MLKRPFIIYALHLFALCSFAIAQPLYDLLAQNVEFFVAHRASGIDVFLIVAVVSFGLPLALAGLEAIAGLAGLRVRRFVHLVLVAVLIGAGVLIALNRLPALSASTALGISVASGLAVTALYARSELLQRFATIASLFAVFFPINLVAFTPVSRIFQPEPTAAKSADIEAATPVVVLLLDEFNVTALLNERQEIDAVRFPNFAALADNAWWFRRATAVNPATIKAVPAILTGRMPTQESVPPSAAGYPDNLFTWLGSSYRFNVFETVTELCPRTLCRAVEDATNRVDFRLMGSDLSIVYLHALLPVQYASTFLPPMDHGWNGFAAGKSSRGQNEEGEHDERDPRQLRQQSRAETFSSFVSHIEAGDRTLDFLHILLPHSPYVYLPNGQGYPGGAEEGVLPDRVWSDNEYLVDLQYQRFLLQAGYVDKLIGDLMRQLRQVGKYDKAMIIVTADHGKAFRPGMPQRNLSKDNAPDVLQIPLFVKLPEQKQGKISDRYVSNIDILPTIGDVIAEKVPWKVDGDSMIGEDFPKRDVLELRTRIGPEGQFTFDRKAVTGYPRLPRMLEIYGTEQPLASLRLRGSHSDLIGKNVAAIPIDGRQEKIVLSLDAMEALRNVDLGAETLPVYWRGEVKGLSDNEMDMPLALALNGNIEAIVPLYAWRDKPFQFSTLIPQAALKSGKNEFRAFLVRQDKAGRYLVELTTGARAYEYEISKQSDGSEVIVSSSGRRIEISPDRVRGWVDNLTKADFYLNVSGWAADVERKMPASEVLVFINERFAYSGSPKGLRQDVSTAYGSSEIARSGYSFRIPSEAGGNAALSIRVFGTTNDDLASELPLSVKANEVVAGAR